VIRSYSRRVGAYEVHVAPLPTVAALLMLTLLLSAGFWQLRRADEKRAIAVEQAYRADKAILMLAPGAVDSASLERWRHRRAIAVGHYRSDMQYLLDNRTHNHSAGYHVLTLLRLRDSDVHLLVNRGWLPVGPDRGLLPEITVGEQEVSPEGMIVAPPAPGLALGPPGYDDAGWPRVVQRVDLDRIQEQLKKPLLPFVLRLASDADFGYARDWQLRTGLSPERHVGYAVQWFALAAALVALSLWVAVAPIPEAHHGR
jgi:surfeit locus 1 family protein